MDNYGYTPDVDAIEAYAASLPPYGDDVSQLVATDDNQDAFLYRPLVFLLATQASPSVAARWLIKDDQQVRLKSYNQGSIGSCVGNAEACCLSITAAIDIVVARQPESFVAMASPEACYGFSREVGGMLGGGDGSYGSAAAKADCELGTLWQIKYDTEDLTEYSVDRCRKYGRSGVPKDLRTTAAEHKLHSSYLIKSVDEAWALIGSGYPINQCSNLGFTSKRDNDGRCKQQGSWGHSMSLIGRRTSQAGNKLFLIQNSWGDTWVSGPLFEDQPPGSFYADYTAVEKAIKQQDCFVKIDIDGFKKKDINWSDW